MDVELSAEQEEFRKIVRAFAEEVVAPRAEAMDRVARAAPNRSPASARSTSWGRSWWNSWARAPVRPAAEP